MRHLPMVVVLVAAWLCGSAAAQNDADPTGIDLLKRCNALQIVAAGQEDGDTESAQDYGYCLGYIVGYVSGFAARDAAGEAAKFCPPASARIADFARAIDQWLVEHPAGLEAMGAVVALKAFRWKFPCPGEARGGKPQ